MNNYCPGDPPSRNGQRSHKPHVSPLASFDRRPEDARFLAVVIPEVRYGDIECEIFLLTLWIVPTTPWGAGRPKKGRRTRPLAARREASTVMEVRITPVPAPGASRWIRPWRRFQSRHRGMRPT